MRAGFPANPAMMSQPAPIGFSSAIPDAGPAGDARCPATAVSIGANHRVAAVRNRVRRALRPRRVGRHCLFDGWSGCSCSSNCTSLSDERVVEHWTLNPYFQFFCGEREFQWGAPCAASELVHFRYRIGSAQRGKTARRLGGVARREGKGKGSGHGRHAQEKAFTFPTDAKLHAKVVQTARRIVRQNGVRLRQSYARTVQKLLQAQRGWRHPRTRQSARKALRRLRAYSGKYFVRQRERGRLLRQLSGTAQCPSASRAFSRTMSSTDLPPLFDFQINGFAGIDFQDPEISRSDLALSMHRLKEHGVGGIFLTLVTNIEDRLCAQLERLESFRESEAAITEVVRGYHLEGPWLKPQVGFCGAHRAELMCAPSVRSFERLQSAAGSNIRLVTLAPEWQGSDEVVAALTAQGVHVAIGHSGASDVDIDVAIHAGARFCTHLGNGVPAMLHRHDNVIQRLLARDELYACFIPDGIHVPPFMLQNMVRAKPSDRVLFTTDAISAAGEPPAIICSMACV